MCIPQRCYVHERLHVGSTICPAETHIRDPTKFKMVRKKKHKVGLPSTVSADRGMNDASTRSTSSTNRPIRRAAEGGSTDDPQPSSSGANSGSSTPSTSSTDRHRRHTKQPKTHSNRPTNDQPKTHSNRPTNDQPKTHSSRPTNDPRRLPHTASASAQNGPSNNQHITRYRGDRRRRSRGRRAGRQPWRDYTSDSSQSSSPASRPTSSQTDAPVNREQPSTSAPSSGLGRDLPGFYFDPIKKKYFRILPGHQSGGSPSTVTMESLKLKATEEVRQQRLREFALRTIQTDPTYGFNPPCTGSHARRCQKSPNINHHVFSLQYGILREKKSLFRRNKLTSHQLGRLQPSCKQKVLPGPLWPVQGKIEHMTKMLTDSNTDPHSPTTRLVCLWSLKSLLVQRIQMIEVNRVARVDGSAIMDSSPVGSILTPSMSKVTDMCWAYKSPDDNSTAPVLYTTTCIMGTSPSLAKLRHLDPVMGNRERDSADTEFHLGRKTTWSCAWSAHTRKFSVGIEESSLLIDVATRRLWQFHTRESDVLAQTFSNTDGNTLYSGTRRGEIVVHDLRSSSTRWASLLSHKSSLSHLHLMKSGRHLLASDFSGKMCMWDLRMCRIVQDFKGHNNEYARIPFTVDPLEKFICGAGQDCYTRVWDISTSEMIISVPPPYPVSLDLIPSVCLYTSPTGHMDRPGLLMGIKDEIHLYTC